MTNVQKTASMQLTQPLKWFPIPGFSAYVVDEHGAIWSCLKAKGTGQGGPISQVNTGVPRRKLRPDLRKEDNRKRYTLRADGGDYIRRYGSYFVLLATVGNAPHGHEACHNNGDCTDDRPSNLRWGTPKSNKADMVLHGTRVRGEKINSAKLSIEDVRNIRRRRLAGELYRTLAAEFKVTEGNIMSIVKHRTWRHVQ